MSEYNFTINQGETFNPTLKYSQPHFTVKAITGLTKSGQAVVTATGHGLTIDWPVWIVGVQGMAQINHRSEDLRVASKAYYGYANSIRLNVDSTRFSTYTSGGELLYHPPVNLTGFTARMQIRASLEDDDTLASLTTENGGITLGGTAGTVALLLSATDTAALDFTSAVYDLELISSGGVVTRLLSGAVTLVPEVTRA
jgi:hypothetical protein